MKRIILLTALTGITIAPALSQRYVTEVFTDNQIVIQQNVTYATNINFLTSSFSNQSKVGADITELKTAVAMGQPFDAKFYNPTDTNSVVKVVDLKMDIYYPDNSIDSTDSRPVIFYLHTGNFLPPPVNGSPVGNKNDSTATEMCKRFAKRGYVAVAINYRLGWNPIASTVYERRGTLLNAVYRAIHDAKMAVRYMREEAAGGNMYGINPNQIVLYGEGTGAYVANAYATMDKFAEISLPKFTNPATSESFIDTTKVGNLDGYNGSLNLYVDKGFDASIQAVVTTGGALADTSWLEAGDPPMISFHCVRDPFAPFSEGVVVVPTTMEDVVEVQGANVYIKKANDLGNNTELNSSTYIDAYSMAARARYGKTYDYIYPSQTTITVTADIENLFPVLRPLGGSLFQNEAGPWQWWDPNSPIAKTVVQAPDITAHQASLASNPDMSPTKGRTYLDTIVSYACPRLADLFGYHMSVRDLNRLTGITVYPNPTKNLTEITLLYGTIETAVVMDVQGREIYRINGVNANRLTIDLSTFNSGIYFVRIATAEGIGTVRLLKE